MANDEAMDLDDEAPPPRMSKMGLLIIGFSVALGILLLAVIGGGIYFAKKTNALQAELSGAKKDIKELKVRVQVTDEMSAQIVAFARELEALKEQVSTPPVLPEPEVAKPAAEPPKAPAKDGAKGTKESGKEHAKEPPKGGKEATPAPSAAPPEKKAASEPFSCDLTGKSPAEQSVILKRCVSVMDTPPPPAKPKPPAR